MRCIFFGLTINTTAYHYGRYSLHLLLQKSSMPMHMHAPLHGRIWHDYNYQQDRYLQLQSLFDGHLITEKENIWYCDLSRIGHAKDVERLSGYYQYYHILERQCHKQISTQHNYSE